MTRPRLQESALRLFPLAWPVFVGQIAVLAFSTVDTLMTARSSALDLAALAIGGSIYISVFVGLMGVILAVGPIAGQLFGAGRAPRERPPGRAGGLAGARADGDRLHRAAPARALPRPGAGRAGSGREGARLPARPRLRPAGLARLHGLSRLQRRGLAAEGGDGAATRRPGAEGAAQRPARLRLRPADAASAPLDRAGARRRRLRHRHRDRHVVPAAGGDRGGPARSRSTPPSAWATACRRRTGRASRRCSAWAFRWACRS